MLVSSSPLVMFTSKKAVTKAMWPSLRRKIAINYIFKKTKDCPMRTSELDKCQEDIKMP